MMRITRNLGALPRLERITAVTTMSTPAEPAAPTGPSSPASPERVRLTAPLRRLLICGNLAIVTTIGAIAAMIAQPIAGTISDRTRSRFGRRAPWLVAGSLIGGLSLVGISLANGVAQITIAWVCVQIAYNFAQGPLSAVMPDRVPAGARGIFSSVAGLAALVASIGGQAVGGIFAAQYHLGYLALAGWAFVLLTLFAVFNKDRSSRDDAREPFRFADFLRTFWVNPARHPDFAWAFLGRLLLYTGYFAIIGYQLFILQDYIGLGARAASYVALVSLIGLVGTIPATILGGIVSDRIGRRKILVFISSALCGLGFLIPLAWHTLPAMFAMSIVVGVGFGAYGAVDQALMTQVLPNENDHAKDLGIVNIAASLPQVLAPAVGGAIVVAFGYTGLFPVAIALSVLGAFAVFFIRSVR
jgi:MFS family permease